MRSDLGKPGEPLPPHLFDGERHDAECQPRVTEYLGTVKLEIPMNNPYWRQCSTEPGALVTALHALSFAQHHAPQEVSHEQLDALWVGQCERPETRVWLKAEALRRRCRMSDVLESLGARRAAKKAIRLRWEELDRIAVGRGAKVAVVADDSDGEAG